MPLASSMAANIPRTSCRLTSSLPQLRERLLLSPPFGSQASEPGWVQQIGLMALQPLLFWS